MAACRGRGRTGAFPRLGRATTTAALLVCLMVAAANAITDSEILAALRDSTSNQVDIVLLQEQTLRYRAWGVWTLPHPMSLVAAKALDLAAYTTTFRDVYRCERIERPARVLSSLGTWYVEGRAGLARVWSIGNIDSIRWNEDSTELHLRASQNQHKQLEAQWREVLPGWINLRTRELRLAAFVVAHGDDSCRVGVVAETRVSKPMPQWLVKLAAQVVLPRLLGDLNRAVAAQREPPATAGRKWWPW